MIIKTAGTYLGLSDNYLILFNVIGKYPYLKIPNGIVLNDFIKGTNGIKMVNENSVEIQYLLNTPEAFAFAGLNDIVDTGFKEIDFVTSSEVELEQSDMKYVDKLKMIDAKQMGIPINSLIINIVMDKGYSIPQARMLISILRKKIKNNHVIEEY